jgi:adenylate kinase family enzyme
MNENFLNILILGPPCSGKGTLANILVTKKPKKL